MKIGTAADAGGRGATGDTGGAYAQPDGRFFVASGRGYATGRISDPFTLTPFPVAVGSNQEQPVGAVFDASGAGFVTWHTSTGWYLGSRTSDGAIASQVAFSGGTQLVMDSAGKSTLAYTKSNGLWIAHGDPGSSTFVDDPGSPVATDPSIAITGLVVDPDGAAVVTWVQGGKLRQATRAAGAAGFGAPGADIYPTNVDPQYVHVASNPAGRAAVVFLADGHYGAAVREPGGAFASPDDLGTTAPGRTPEPSYLPPNFQDAAAVSADGTAAALVTTTTQLSCDIPPASGSPPSDPGFAYGLESYRLDPGASHWTHAGSIGGAGGNSTAYPALAGGPGNRIDAAWAVDKRSEDDRCHYTNEPPFGVVAGQLFPSAAPVEIFSDTPADTGTTQGTIYNAGPRSKLAINSCGDGVLSFVISLGLPEDGMYLSKTGACSTDPGSGGSGQPPGDSGQPGGNNPPPPTDTGQAARDALARANALKELNASIDALKKAATHIFDDPNTTRFGFRIVSAGGGKFVINLLQPVQSQAPKLHEAKKRKPIVLASATKTFGAAGKHAITVKITAAGRKLLRSAARHHRALKLKLTEQFTPKVDGRTLKPVTVGRSLSLHPKAHHRH